MLAILLSLSLGVLIVAGIFDMTIDIENLAKQEDALIQTEDNLRFMAFYLRRRIHEAGDWSCLSREPSTEIPNIEKLSVARARERFGVSAIVNSQVLLLRECVRIESHRVYVPVLFFLRDTGRKNERHQKIIGFYMKIDHHPSEELFEGMRSFEVSIKNKMANVVIYFVLQSVHAVFHSNNHHYFSLAGILDVDKKSV